MRCFLLDKLKSLASRKAAATVAGACLVESWPQAAVVIAYVLGQAYVDSRQ